MAWTQQVGKKTAESSIVRERKGDASPQARQMLLINKIKQSQTTATAFFNLALSLFYMYTLIKLIPMTIRKQHPTVWVPMVCYII